MDSVNQARAFPGWRRGLVILGLVLLSVVLATWGYVIKGLATPGDGFRCQAAFDGPAQNEPVDREVRAVTDRLSAMLECASYVAYSTMQVFTLGANEPYLVSGGPSGGNAASASPEGEGTRAIPQLHLARLLLGGLAIYGAFAFLASASRRVRWIVPVLFARLRTRHHVVIGLGARGVQTIRGRAAGQDRRPVVGVALQVSPLDHNLESIGGWRHAPWRRVLLIEGDARHQDVLAGCRVRHALTVTILCGDDALNLEIAGAIQEVMKRPPSGWRSLPKWGRGIFRGRFPRQRAPKRLLQINVHLDNSLVRRHFGSLDTRGDAFRTRFFSMHQLAARMFWQKFKLPYEAEIRGHARLHIVLIDFGDLAEEMLKLVAILWPYRDMTRPLVTIVSEAPDQTVQRIESRYPQLAEAAEWRVLPLALRGMELPAGLLEQIEAPVADETGQRPARIEAGEGECRPAANAEAIAEARMGAFAIAGAVAAASIVERKAPPVSAVIVCTPDDTVNLAIAKRFRSLAWMTGRCRAPLYPYIQGQVYLASTSTPCTDEARFSRLIQAFGQLDEDCRLFNIEEEVDLLASVLQTSYQGAVLGHLRSEALEAGWSAFNGPSADARSNVIGGLGRAQSIALLPFIDAFDQQSDEERELNRLPALHFGIKVLDLGYAFPTRNAYALRWPVKLQTAAVALAASPAPASRAVAPSIEAKGGLSVASHLTHMASLQQVHAARWQGRQEIRRQFDAGQLTTLSLNEHRRWMNQRFVSGWRHAEHRDDVRFTHPKLSPLDAGDAERIKIEDQILMAFQPVEMLSLVAPGEEQGAIEDALRSLAKATLVPERWTALTGEADPDPVALDQAGLIEGNGAAGATVRAAASRLIELLPPGDHCQVILVTRLQCGEETLVLDEVFSQLERVRQQGGESGAAPCVCRLRCLVVEGIPRQERLLRYAWRCAVAAIHAEGLACLSTLTGPPVFPRDLPGWIRWLRARQGGAGTQDRSGQEARREPAAEVASSFALDDELLAYQAALETFRATLDQLADPATVATDQVSQRRALWAAIRTVRPHIALGPAQHAVPANVEALWSDLIQGWRWGLRDRWARLAGTYYGEGSDALRDGVAGLRSFMKPRCELPSLDWVVELYDDREPRAEGKDADFTETAQGFASEQAYIDGRCTKLPIGLGWTLALGRDFDLAKVRGAIPGAMGRGA